MHLSTALLIAGAVIALALIAGLVWRVRDGRRRAAGGLRVDQAHLSSGTLATRATLVLLSSEFCSRCPQVRRMLQTEAAGHDGVSHAEIDLTDRAELASGYRVLQTPTVLLVDADGTVRTRWAGAPRQADVAAAVASILSSASTDPAQEPA